MKSDTSLIISIILIWVMIAIYCVQHTRTIVSDKVDTLSVSKYRVYYEYNVIHGDTIPIDTVYIHIK